MNITKEELETKAKDFEPLVFKNPDPLWEPARVNIRQKIAMLLKSAGHTVEGYE